MQASHHSSSRTQGGPSSQSLTFATGPVYLTDRFTLSKSQNYKGKNAIALIKISMGFFRTYTKAVEIDTSYREAMAKLKAAMLAAQTLDELYALMEAYSYEEFMQIYNQLTPEQQVKLDAIDELDNKAQMLALHTEKVPFAKAEQLSQLTGLCS